MFFTHKHFQKILGSVLLLLLFFGRVPVFAQSANNTSGDVTLGIARIVTAAQKDLKDGSIVSTSQKGAVLSTTAYDPQVLGVVSRDAAIILSNDTQGGDGIPVVSNGTVYVLVSTADGTIKKGDQITTSTIPGVGVKAIKDGYVLGTAMEDDPNPNTKSIDKIAVDVELHYFNSKPTLAGSLTDIFKLALLPTKEGPSAIFKYAIAAIVVVASFILGFMTFGRTAAKGVEALGRNPAAGKIINLGIIFNVGIVVIIVLSGLVVAFLILRL